MKEYQMYINGEWIPTISGNMIDDINPANGKPFARIHMAGPDEVEAALSAAETAQNEWEMVLADQKEQMINKAADNLAMMMDEVISILIEESGSTYMKAKSEVLGSIGTLRVAAGECRRVGSEVYQPTSQGSLSLSVRQPMGVVLGIAPFNYPLLLALKKIAYALAAGNTFILKPASVTPITGCVIARIFHDAGLPKGVLNVIPGLGSVVGNLLVEDPRVKVVTFTGSSEVGLRIAQKAASHLKRYTMELGGKNPLILLTDYDIDKAVEIAGYGAFFHQGQVCMATSRIIVERPSYDDFCKKMVVKAQGLKVGDPWEHDTVIGPLIEEKQCRVIDAQIQDAVNKGARVLTGGKHKGAFYEPTVLAEVTPEMEIFYEESFGPITTVICAENSEHALELCNNNKYGLSSALLTNDLNKALSLGLRMEAGKVHINDTTFVSNTTAPSGGFKLSGFGKEGGHYSIEDFTELKWITIQYKDKKMPH